jgi:calcium binding protein 39
VFLGSPHVPILAIECEDSQDQVFVANPNKSVAVQRILISNREKLLRFLPSFLEDRTEDDQFIDEKSFLIRQIEQLPPAPVPPPTS